MGCRRKLKHRGVVIARDYKFMCSSLGQELIEKDIKELGLNRVVVAACSPHLHEKTFRTACANAGLNPLHVRDGLDPRAGLVGAHRQGRGDGQGQGHDLRRRGARAAP